MSDVTRPAATPSDQALAGGRVFADGRLHAGRAVLIRDGRVLDVVAVGAIPAGFSRFNLADTAVLAPGFIDWQVNGGGGVMLNDSPDALGMAAIARAHRRFGTTGLLPTLITDRPERLRALAEIGSLSVPGVLGLHIEGPFINVARKGVHPADCIRPMQPEDVALLEAIGRLGRSVVTLAPECQTPGTIETLVKSGLTVSIGHSQATADEVRAAADAGARGVTHLFNAMSQITPREPGVVGAAFDDPRLTVGLIPDGLHVDPVNLRIAFRQLGVERLALVTDAMSLVGAEADHFSLMGRAITLTDGKLTASDGTLAGAHLSMIGAVRRMVLLAGVSLEEALTMASTTPAAFLGLGNTMGAIRPGFRADLVAFDADFRVIATWLGGEREISDGDDPTEG